jgi:hypothetical protein
MIPYRFLAMAPLVWAAAVLGLAVALRGAVAVGWLLLLHQRGTLVLAGVACWRAARTFEPGDHMRAAWILLTGSFALLGAGDVAARVAGPGTGPALQGLLVVAANVAGVAATWVLARTWRVAALALDAGGGTRGLVQAIAVGLAAAVTIPAVVTSLPGALAGHGAALIDVASSLGDLLVLAMLAPILLTALSLRGGLVAWPWAFLSVAAVAWILVDGVAAFGVRLGLRPGTAELAGALLQGLAILYEAAAATAQRQVVEQLQGGRLPRA